MELVLPKGHSLRGRGRRWLRWLHDVQVTEKGVALLGCVKAV